MWGCPLPPQLPERMVPPVPLLPSTTGFLGSALAILYWVDPDHLPEGLAPTQPTPMGFLDSLLQWYNRRENPALLRETCLLIASCKFYVLTGLGLSSSENEELRSRARDRGTRTSHRRGKDETNKKNAFQ